MILGMGANSENMDEMYLSHKFKICISENEKVVINKRIEKATKNDKGHISELILN